MIAATARPPAYLPPLCAGPEPSVPQSFILGLSRAGSGHPSPAQPCPAPQGSPELSCRPPAPDTAASRNPVRSPVGCQGISGFVCGAQEAVALAGKMLEAEKHSYRLQSPSPGAKCCSWVMIEHHLSWAVGLSGCPQGWQLCCKARTLVLSFSHRPVCSVPAKQGLRCGPCQWSLSL